MHIFNPSNPTLTIQSGLQYFIGRAGLCTQLSPIFAGQGTGSGNPAPNSPGQPNAGAPGSGPYNPIFPPFPGGFATPKLTTFNATMIYNGGGNSWQVNINPPETSGNVGSLNSGGGINGAVLGNFSVFGTSAAVSLDVAALKSTFATNPFTGAQTSVFTQLSFPTTTGTQTFTAASAIYSPNLANALYWKANWDWSPAPPVDLNAGSNITVTITVM